MSRVLSRIAMTLSLLLATLWWSAGPTHQAHAATATVACSQTAVQAALNAGGSYAFAGDCTLTITPTLSAGNTTTPTTLDGAGHAVVFDGANATQILIVSGGVALTLVDLTLRHGKGLNAANAGVGAVDNSGALTVIASTLSFNSAGAGAGGAVYNNGTLTVTASTLSFNSARLGGAVLNDIAGTVTISASTLASNSATFAGGAMYNLGRATISASTLVSNTAPYAGGAVYDFCADQGKTSAGCASYYVPGVGIVYNSGALTIIASTLVSNSAATYGGAVFIDSGGTAMISASTLVSNTATTNGGAVYNRGGTVTLGDTLLAGNDCAGSPPGSGYGGGLNLTYNAPGCPGSVSGQDPLLSPLANNGGPTQTLAVGPGSPAIGAGDPALCNPGATDQRGVARTLATCTSGAYEYQDSTLQNQAITFNALPTKTYGDSPFDVSGYAAASSGLTVSFSSATSGVCTVSGSTVTSVSAGTCTITADQAGNGTYAAAARVQQSFTVARATPIITWTTPTGITYGTPLSAMQIGCDGIRARQLHLHPGVRHGPECGQRSDALGPLHTDRCDQVQHRSRNDHD